MAAPYFKELYGEINQGSHRKAAENIGAPALIWHQALWNSRHDPKKKKRRARRIKEYLQALHNRIKDIDTHLQPPSEYIIVLPTDRVRVITFSFDWQGVRVKIRYEIHIEYLTITSIVDLSVKVKTACDKIDARAAHDKLKPLIDSLNEQLQKNVGVTYDPNDAAQQEIRSQLSLLHTPLYRDFWDSNFDEDIIDVPTGRGNTPRRYLSSGMLGRKFADFRCVITSETYPDPIPVEVPKVDLANIKEARLQSPFYKDRDEVAREQGHRTAKPSERWARLRLNAAWPFLEAAQEQLPGRTEYTVSRLMEGRILYVSALGPQPREESATPGEERPVYFYMHSNTRCERQIGRTVDRLVNLGTLRLAAILPIKALKDVAGKLRSAEVKIGTARRAVHKLIVDAQVRKPPLAPNVWDIVERALLSHHRRLQQRFVNPTLADLLKEAATDKKRILTREIWDQARRQILRCNDGEIQMSTPAAVHDRVLKARISEKPKMSPEDREAAELDIVHQLDEIQGDMASASSDLPVRISNTGRPIQPTSSQILGDESIEYRLIRSQYYKNIFDDQMQTLRIKRLEGFQPYDEFVKRRLQGTFGFIDGIERRIAEIKDDWRSLDQLYLAANVTILTGEIDNEQKASLRTQSQIRKLQEFADFALFFVLIPYYLGNIIIHIAFPIEFVRTVFDETFSFSLGHKLVHDEIKSSRIVWLAALIFSVAAYLINRFVILRFLRKRNFEES